MQLYVFSVAPVLTFCQLNDVALNRKESFKYFGEYKKIVKDRAYTAEEICKALQTADLRMKVIILLMSSGGRIKYVCLVSEHSRQFSSMMADVKD
jgi:hypothetical protein